MYQTRRPDGKIILSIEKIGKRGPSSLLFPDWKHHYKQAEKFVKFFLTLFCNPDAGLQSLDARLFTRKLTVIFPHSVFQSTVQGLPSHTYPLRRVKKIPLPVSALFRPTGMGGLEKI